MLENTEMGNSPVPSEKRKVSKSETGHAINLANLVKLIAICLGFGADYNPGNSSITLAALTARQTAASAVLTLLNNLVALHIIAKDKRAIAFKPFNRLLIRIHSAVKASNVSSEFISDVKTLVRKLQGKRAKAKEKAEENTPVVPETELHNYISVSQLSFDNRIENFHKLIQLLQNEPNYVPNEADLSIAGLTTHYNLLLSLNNDVITAKTNEDNKRIERNEIMYNELTGLVRQGNDAKNYIKSLYGPQSQQYKQVAGLKFRGGADLANKLK